MSWASNQAPTWPGGQLQMYYGTSAAAWYKNAFCASQAALTPGAKKCYIEVVSSHLYISTSAICFAAGQMSMQHLS